MLAGHGQSISGVCESGQRGWPHPSRGSRAPTPLQTFASPGGRGGSKAQRGPGKWTQPQFGVPRATARLRRRGWPAKQEPPKLPSAPRPLFPASSVLRESRKEGRLGLGHGGRKGVAFLPPGFTLFPGKRPGGSPKALSGLASEGRDPGHSGRPQPGGRWGVCVSSTSRVWPPGPGLEQRHGSQLVRGAGPTAAPTPSPGLTQALRGSVDTQMGVRRARGSCAYVAGRGGRRESEKQGRQVWWPPTRSNSHNSHGVDGGMHSRPQAQTDRRAHRGRPGDWLSQCRGAWSWLLPIYPVCAAPPPPGG